ncbi:hypothetical protein NXS19_000737 [Fusarium pseudograminearum]|nr:hypothetical protein NXS19_000737 [Fusarium pseudograminearum]
MAATYKQFLAAPSSSLLADTAALHYVTTTTTFAGPTQIIKHLSGLQKQVSKKKEDVFNIVDGGNVIVLEIDTGLGFQNGGGPYLPGLDDNFLSGREVYLPITHFVTFDEAGKIAQIRLQWDQGSLLKQVEVIGKSGRNWPIIDSREQIAFIQSCIRTAGTAAPAAPSHNETVARDRTNSKNALRDPHANRLFGSRDEFEDAEPATVVSPYAGTRPRQRSFTEILGDEPTSPSAGRRAMSPSKGGQGKNFQPSRIFDGQEDVEREPVELQQHTKKRYIKPHPKKYSHFDFADGTDPQDSPQKGQHFDDLPKTKRDSQWSFEDFTTPQKVKPSKTMRTQDIRHWDTDKDATEDTRVYQVAKPRRDGDPHFELPDDVGKNELPLGNITNVKDRGKDFDHHFEIADNSPAHPQQHTNEGHKKAIQMMDRHWDTYDKSPASQKENRPTENTASHKINIAGDGMGGRKGTNRDWLYGETDDVAQPIPTRKQPSVAASDVPLTKSTKISIAGDGMGGRKGADRDWLYNETSETANDEPTNTKPIPGQTPASNTAPANEVKENTDKHKITIAGDGMGGRKGTNRDWLYGETDELANNAPTNTKPVPGRTPASNTAPANEVKENTDKHKINIAGDGMGGRKGANRDWLFMVTRAMWPRNPFLHDDKTHPPRRMISGIFRGGECFARGRHGLQIGSAL